MKCRSSAFTSYVYEYLEKLAKATNEAITFKADQEMLLFRFDYHPQVAGHSNPVSFATEYDFNEPGFGEQEFFLSLRGNSPVNLGA